MTHDIIDNQSQKLVDTIRTILPGTQSAKFAVGYFFLSGLEAVADVLQNVIELRLLIGNVSSRETIEQIAEGYHRLEQIQEAAEAIAYPKRVEQTLRAGETARTVGQGLAVADQTDEVERLVGILVRLIEEKRLKVKIYTKGRLHAKAYIFDYGQVYDAAGNIIPRDEKGLAIVGSSNFTLSGVSHNTELNVRVHGNDNHAALSEWFKHLWDEAQDFEAHLMDELRQSWPLAQVKPYDIYIKTLYELTKDRLEGEAEAEFLWQSEITAALADFQRSAVRQAVQMIRQYGGCFVADVVGLGKSYIGAAIVKHFERSDRVRSLIICPAPLEKMWQHYNDAYDLNAKVVSMGLLTEGKNGENPLLENEHYRNRDFVLVDESHNFRNSGTQRYRVLQAYLQTGDRRCVFLTATPRNKTAWDIYNQIRLFHVEETTRLPVDPPNLRQYFKMIEDGQRQLPSLLSHILVRRTRNEILRWYGFDAKTHQRVDPDNFAPYRRGEQRAFVEVAGRPQFFPRRELGNIEYRIERTYRGLYDHLREYLSPRQINQTHGQQGILPGLGDAAKGLLYARFGLWHYVKLEKKRKSPYNELQRAGINLRGLMRISLFKRFESSVEAFRCTLQRMVRSHQAFLDAMAQGIVPAGEDAQAILYESDQYEEQELFDALEEVCGRYDIQDFLADALRTDVEHDLRILQEMLDLVSPITPDQDDKLQVLIASLKSGGSNHGPLTAGKCLIFTQYADTARYLYDNINPHGDPHIEVIYGRDKDKTAIVGRFAPRANPEQAPKDEQSEINLLIATDVLSEGLNLQDCDRVINYDLHWNPVRLIQRFGRIDRIGSEFDKIYGYNFLPEKELERNLGLREKLQHRIQEIHDTIGEDAAILDPTERINEKAFYAIYQDRSVEDYEEDGEDQLVDLNEAQEIVRQLKEDDPQTYSRIVNLRDGIRCGRQKEQPGTVILCRAGNYRKLYLLDETGEIASHEIPAILSLLRCTPETPAAPLPEGYNTRVHQVQKAFAAEVQARSTEQAHTLALTNAQKYVLRELRLVMGQTDDPDLQAQIGFLEEVFRVPINQAVRQELNTLKRSGVKGMDLLGVLDHIYHRHNLRKTREDRASEEDPLPVIVCSEGLVKQ